MPYDVNPIIDQLCEIFPDCFNRAAPRPLRIGLGEEAMALAGVHPALADLTRTRIRRAIKVYTSSFAYRKALAAGGPRYGLDGQPAGEVTPEQQAFAKTPPQKPAKPVAPGGDPMVAAPAPLAPPIDRTALLQEIITMAIPGKLDVTVKINQLPQAKPASAQTMLFAIQTEGQTVAVELKNKAWNSLKTAAETYPQWVAAITGKIGATIPGGFRLDSPAVQVFEKKAKPEVAAAPLTESKAPEPKAPEPVTEIGRPRLSLKGRQS